MAYYQITFEGKKYVSSELFQAFGRTGITGLMRAPQKMVLDTLVFGPTTEAQDKALKNITFTAQDFDAQNSAIVKADGSEQTLALHIDDEAVIKYRNKKYVRIADLKIDNNKYRMLPRIASVRVCGRGVYVVLDAKNKEVTNPIVITEAK